MIGKKFGPPPLRGPNPQGLNIIKKKNTTVRLEKINGEKKPRRKNYKTRSFS